MKYFILNKSYNKNGNSPDYSNRQNSPQGTKHVKPVKEKKNQYIREDAKCNGVGNDISISYCFKILRQAFAMRSEEINYQTDDYR
jgi:hypothetical protein